MSKIIRMQTRVAGRCPLCDVVFSFEKIIDRPVSEQGNKKQVPAPGDRGQVIVACTTCRVAQEADYVVLTHWRV
jgi:hypothetical protein